MPTLQFITGSGSGSTVATGVVGQIAALNQSIANLNNVYFQYYSTGATTNNSVSFYLNGNLTTISNCDPTLTLVDYLRYQTPYKGVKQHCRQGGCGVCAVMVSYYDSDSATFRNVSLNSCLKLVVQCDGLAIWTTEGIKIDSRTYHPVQERISKTYGLQCGACTTAQVMSQYTALQPGTFMQRAEYAFLEKNFDGNLCRCSCYPGIVAMARSFLPTGSAYSPAIYNGSTLIGWDLSPTGGLNTSCSTGSGDFFSNLGSSTSSFTQKNLRGFMLYNSAQDKNATSNSTISTYLQNFTPVAGTYINSTKGVTYARVTSLASLISQIQIAGVTNCKIVAGATSYGVPGYARPTTNLFLDVNYISDLHASRVTSTGAVFGSNVPINKAVSLMYTGASTDTKFNDIADHLFYISGQHVRNVASLVAGLVMSKKGGFASDVSPLMIAANATLNCTYIYPGYTVDVSGLSIQDYFNVTETDKFLLIKSIVIPAKATGEVFYSYRVAQRYFNSSAWLNCAASYTVTANVISNARIAYGGLVGGFGVARATNTENYLNGKDISSASAGSTGALNTIISGATTQIATDLNTIISPIAAFAGVAAEKIDDGKVAFRKNLGTTLFYLSFLNLLKNQGYLTNYATVQNSLETWISGTPDSNRIANIEYSRGGWDLYNTTSEYPIRTTFQRQDGIQIASGEVRYNDDIPVQQGTLWLAFALSTIAVGEVDWSSSQTISSLAAARATPGVSYVFTAQDYYTAVKDITTQNAIIIPGYSAITNYTGAIMQLGGMGLEILGDRFISYYGQRIAGVLAADAEIARKVADNIVFGYKNTVSTYAVSIQDAITKAGVPEFSKTGSATQLNYMTNLSTSTWGYNNAAYTRSAAQVYNTYPYTGGNGAIELQPGYINIDANGNNLIPFVSSPTGYVLPDGTIVENTYVFTGPRGDMIPWSPYIIQSTGAYTQSKFQMPLERTTFNCYRNEGGAYTIYGTVQQSTVSLNAVKSSLGLVNVQLDYHSKRVGGAFGAKLGNKTTADFILTILACYVANGAMVRYVPELKEDMITNGAEAECYFPYRAGFNASGALNSLYFTPYTTSPYNVNPNWRLNSPGYTGYTATAGDTAAGLLDQLKGTVNNTQNIPGVYVVPTIVYIPRAPHVPMRGPYAQNLNWAYSHIMDNISSKLGLSFTDVSYINAPQYEWILPTTNSPTGSDKYIYQTMMNKLESEPQYDYVNRKDAVATFNTSNKYVKRGLEISYGKYIIFGWTAASAADIMIRITPNGDVIVYPSAAESGQGSWIKLQQFIASKLKCPISLIKIVEGFNHDINYGDAGNGGSRGTMNIIRAADDACNKLLVRFAPNLTGAANGDVYTYGLYNTSGVPQTGTYANLSSAMTGNSGLGNPTAWKALVTSQCSSWTWNVPGVNQTPQGYAYPKTYANYMTPTQNSTQSDIISMGNTMYSSSLTTSFTGSTGVNQYVGAQPVYMASMTETEVNMLTGNVRVIRADILADLGNSINPSIDMGQMYGGYIYSLGATFKEERTYSTSGQQLVTDTWDYKPPCIVDIPQVFNVNFNNNTGAYWANNAPVLLGGKDINELTASATVSAFFSAKSAIRSFRTQQGLSATFDLVEPATPDRIQAAAGFTPSMLNVNPV